MRWQLICLSICIGHLLQLSVRAESIALEIVPNMSQISVTLDAGFAADTSAASTVSGTAVLELTPSQAPFSGAQLQELNLTIDDATSLTLSLGLITVTATATPGSLTTEIVTPGTPTALSNGRFDQPGNSFRVAGLVDLSIQDDPIDLATLDPAMVDLASLEISIDGNELTLQIPVSIEVEETIEDVPIVGSLPILVNLDGMITAVGQLPVASNPGDFNRDGVLDASDIDALTAAVMGDFDERFDVNADGQLDAADRSFWIESLKETSLGDSNLDGAFDSGDFIAVFQAGEYEDAIELNSTWATGDWNGDHEFDTGDLIMAFQAGDYVGGDVASVVPEPFGAWTLYLGAFAIYWFRRR